MSKKIIFYLLLIGLLIRLGIGLWTGYNLNSDYAQIARNIAQAKGYSLDGLHPTAFRSPGYPLILAGIMFLFGQAKLPFIFLHALIAAINAVLCAQLGARLFQRKAGVVAGIIYIFIPYLAYQEAVSESGLVSLGLLAALYLLIQGRSGKNLFCIGLSGIMLAFSYLVRPTVGLIPIFISLALLFDLRRQKKISWNMAAAVILIFTFCVGILPWGLRNKKVFARWYFSQTLFWDNLAKGNNARTFQIYPYLSLDNYTYILHKNIPGFVDEFAIEDWIRQKAQAELHKFKAADLIKGSLRKLFYLWHIRLVPYTDRIGNDALDQTLDRKRSLTKNLVFSIPYILLIISAGMGFGQERRRKRLLLFLAGFLLFFSMPYMIFFAYSRYATPVYFILIILAARGLVFLAQKLNYLTQSAD